MAPMTNAITTRDENRNANPEASQWKASMAANIAPPKRKRRGTRGDAHEVALVQGFEVGGLAGSGVIPG